MAVVKISPYIFQCDEHEIVEIKKWYSEQNKAMRYAEVDVRTKSRFMLTNPADGSDELLGKSEMRNKTYVIDFTGETETDLIHFKLRWHNG
jgi:calcineurin-like phosphoesterase